jgi:transcriptional regulator with XRE-family HTH domain
VPAPEHRIVAELIRDARTKAGLKQSELAERLGVSQSVVSKNETGERRLDVVELHAICAVCGVKMSSFIERLEAQLGGKRSASR